MIYKVDIHNALYGLFINNGDTAAFLGDNGLPNVKYFALWTGQDEEPENNLPIQYPAILVDFENTLWDNKGKQTQTGKATIAIRVVMQSYVSTAKNAPQDHVTKTNELLRYSAYIDYLVRHSLDSNNEVFGKFVRVADGSVVRSKSVFSELIRYQVTVNDNVSADSNFVLGRALQFKIAK